MLKIRDNVTSNQLEALGFSPSKVGEEIVFVKTDLFTRLTIQICDNSGEITVLDSMGIVIDAPKPHHMIGLVVVDYIDRG